MWRVATSANKEKLLLDEASNVRIRDESGDDDMLLSVENESAPTLISTPSIITSSLSSTTSKRPLISDEIDHNADFSLAYSSSASVLSLVAMRVLIAGCVGPNHQGLNGVKMQNPPSDAALASLVPTMFNPGYLRV